MTVIGPIPLNKGWMSDSDYFNCPEGGALTMYGFGPWGNGAIKTMDGYNIFAPVVLPSGTSPFGFISWQDPAQLGNQGPILVAPSNGQLYTTTMFNLGSGSWSNRIGATTPANAGVYTFDVLNGKLLLFNSGSSYANVPLVITTYNGNAAVLGGTPPIANIVKVCNNFAFAAQVLAAAGTQSTLYWSAVADPTTWPSANNLTFRQGDGDYITALSAIGTNLFIFKQHSIGVLNTSTNVISGAVTLGPLTTFSDRVGCVGHQAIDTMPDGSIVFLGMDRHIYQTDGSVIRDLSSLPAPNSNMNQAINYTLGFPPDIYSATGAPLASIRVDPMFHRIIVQMSAHTGTINPIYAYDYFYKTWSDLSEYSNDSNSGGFGFVNCLSVMPNQVVNSSGFGSSVWMGYSNGFMETFNPFLSLQHASLSANWGPLIFETSVQIGGKNPPDFCPRTVIIPFTFPNGTSGGGHVQVFIGYDGTYSSTAAYDTQTSFPSIVRVPILEKIVGNTAVHGQTLNIKIKLTGIVSMAQMVIEPIYISDEGFS